MNKEKSIYILTKSNIKICKNKQGLYHRLDGPALIYPNGFKQWYIDGICYITYREDRTIRISFGSESNKPFIFKNIYLLNK